VFARLTETAHGSFSDHTHGLQGGFERHSVRQSCLHSVADFAAAAANNNTSDQQATHSAKHGSI
jgi:hypothetical protein